jgi:hypothetical protein
MWLRARAEVTCEDCGAVFIAEACRVDLAMRRRFCDVCLKQIHTKNVKKLRACKRKRTCEICGDDFIGVTSSKYCSAECKTIAARQRRLRHKRGLNPKTKECVECGKEFEIDGSKKFCSLECQTKHRNRRVREKIDPKWLRRWGKDGPKYHGKADCFTGAKL